MNTNYQSLVRRINGFLIYVRITIPNIIIYNSIIYYLNHKSLSCSSGAVCINTDYLYYAVIVWTFRSLGVLYR